MSNDPFGNPMLAALGSQMAQAWQTSLETWWKALLEDSGKLGDLAARLTAAGGRGASQRASAHPEDVERVIHALELMEQRIATLEGQFREVAGSLGDVLAFLERLSAGSDAEGGAGGPADKTEER